MVAKNRRLYLANVWPELITKRGIRLFRKKGWLVGGNWLNGTSPSLNDDVIFMAPANFDGAITVSPEDFSQSRIFPYLLFPDELVGWSNDTNEYLLKPNAKFLKLFTDTYLPIFSHSRFTTELVLKTYPQIERKRVNVTYLPIDYESIAGFPDRKGKKLKVLWNHAWRSDKGVIKAFEAIDVLSKKYPRVSFYVGKNRRWGNKPDVEKVRRKATPLLKTLNEKKNVQFVNTFRKHKDYLAFLKGFDIGFSSAYHEGFGLSMMEQAAAGIACVVPNRESYPELMPRALLYPDGKLEKSISALIEDSILRNTISRHCQKDAFQYDAKDWVDRILAEIQKYL